MNAKQPGNIIHLIILLLGLLIIAIAMNCCHSLEGYEKVYRSTHHPASYSTYSVKIFWKEKLSIPDDEFRTWVMWYIENTDYIKIRWISRYKRDGSGDLTLQWAIVYYGKD